MTVLPGPESPPPPGDTPLLPAGGGLLDGLVVAEISDGPAAAFCGRLFADHGASVTLVEPAGGSRLRARGPFDPSRPPADASLAFWHLSTAKKSLALPVERVGDHEALAGLVSGCEVVVTDQAEVAARLEGAGPVVCLVADFHLDGPYADLLGGELVQQALGGSMAANGTAGLAPLYGFGYRASYSAGTAAYIACLAALIGGGRDRMLRVSVHEVLAAMAQNITSQFDYNGVVERRGASTRPAARLQMADGWLVLFVMPGDWPALCAALGHPELADDPRFGEYPQLIRHWPEARDALAAICRDLPAAPTAQRLADSGVAARHVVAPNDLFADGDLTARRFWQEVPAADGTCRRALGPVARFAGFDRVLGPAPRLGEHPRALPAAPTATTTAATTTAAGPARAAPGSRPSGDSGAPLAGVRVLDFTSAWAGPMATRILAGLGATVVKVEGARRMDGWRGQVRPSDPTMYPGLEPGERPWNRNAWFNTQNRGKLSVVIDVKTARGHELVRDLACLSDVVIANARPGFLAGLGLDHDSLAGRAPQLISVDMPAYGTGSPSARHRALGPTMEAATGITHFIGYFDGPPLGSGTAYLDPIGAYFGAATVLSALYHRRHTGVGVAAELAQREAAMHYIGEWLLEADATGSDRLRLGNGHPWHCPHGVYPCAGDDRWIAISVQDDRQFRALAGVLDRPGWLTDRHLGGVGGRRAHAGHIDEVISAWTRELDRDEVFSRLRAAGVPAAPVCDATDLAADPELLTGGFFTRLTHPEAGTHTYPGLPFPGLLASANNERPAPCFAEHNRQVLGDWLGLGDDEIDALYQAGVLADVPAGG